jgi:hypothetical protein
MKFMTVAQNLDDGAMHSGFHDNMERADFVVQYVMQNNYTLDLYERIDGAYVKVAEYGAADD